MHKLGLVEMLKLQCNEKKDIILSKRVNATKIIKILQVEKKFTKLKNDFWNRKCQEVESLLGSSRAREA